MANKINKKNSRKSHKKSNNKSNKKLNKKKVGGSDTEHISTLSQLRHTYFDFSEVDLFKRDFLNFLMLVYGTPKKIKMHNKDDINAIKRIASGIKTQQFLLNNHLLIPKDRIYEKNNQGFLIYKNGVSDNKLYTFLKPSAYDLKHNLMRNRLYLVESNENQDIDEFKTFVKNIKFNDKINTLKNIVWGDVLYGGDNKSGHKVSGGVPWEVWKLPKEKAKKGVQATKDVAVKVAQAAKKGISLKPSIDKNIIHIVKIKDLKFELDKSNDLNISNFVDFQININPNKQSGSGASFFESVKDLEQGSLLRSNDDEEKLKYKDLSKQAKEKEKLYIVKKDFPDPITLKPIHKLIPKKGGKTYTQLLHENTNMLKDFKNKSDTLNVNSKLKKYFPEEGNYKFNLNNDGIKQVEIERKLQNEPMKEFNKSLEEL